MNKEEKEYLKNYNIADYERPSIATDIVVFSVLNDGERDNIRKLQKKKLKVLLIKRGSYPFKNCYAMPGGFCIPGEDVIDTARRELYEETNVGDVYLKLVGVYGEKDRDPRGWIISNTFMALMNGEDCKIKAGTDAWEAKWFGIKVESDIINKQINEDEIITETNYNLILDNSEDNINITATIKEKKIFKNNHENVSYTIINSDKLAFDHGKIILNALLTLRKEVDYNLRVAFDLMPERFTLTGLQNVYELILDKKLLTANFRRKIAGYVMETEDVIEGEGFRPAKLYKQLYE